MVILAFFTSYNCIASAHWNRPHELLRLLCMKKIILFTLLAVVPTLSFGQEVYKSLLEEGKAWKYRKPSANPVLQGFS